MPAKRLELRIIMLTREERLSADMVVVRATTGDLGVLSGRAPVSAALAVGEMRVYNGEAIQRMKVYGGVMRVESDIMTVITELAEVLEDA